MKKVKLNPHHLECLYMTYRNNANDSNIGYVKTFLRDLIEGYNPVFAFRHVRLAKSIRNNPDLEIEVVSNLDDVCRSLCNKREDRCSIPQRLLPGSQIKLNKTYKAGELFKIVNEYYDKELNYQRFKNNL